MRSVKLLLLTGLVAAAPAALVFPPTPAVAALAAAPSPEANLKTLEAQLAKKPKDAALKKRAAEANYQVGHAMMVNPQLPPRVKYPGALKHFRRALQLNPKLAKAAAEKKQIEDIYKQMGREVPQ